MENQKLTEDEIKNIQELQGKRQSSILELGNLEAYQYDIDTRKDELFAVLDELRKSDQELGKELNEKYGDGSIDLEKGEFIPQEKA
jgi:hypothetical protein|tara:strand:- start:1244 stop:1501 length:258 start_codon:yes stop_codon:yes gene_type:complete